MTYKIIVTGANGQLGHCLRDIAADYPAYKFIFTDFEDLDITDGKAVAELFAREQPAWVVNAAAYTAVDKAETDLDKARLLNATAVGILASESKKEGASLVHISTDYVFEGNNPAILTEEMPTNPQSVYGKTKLEGEKEAMSENPNTVVLRTSWLYSIYGSNFVKTMRKLGAERSEVNVVADQWGSPTSGEDLAIAVMTAISKIDKSDRKEEKNLFGIYHFSNEGSTCWADFAEQIMGLSGLQCAVNHILTAEYPTAAKRPEFSLMSKSKFTNAFAVAIPEWEVSLEKIIEKLNSL